MRLLSIWGRTCFFVMTATVLSCAGTADQTKPTPATKTTRDGYAGLQCETPPFVVDQIVPLGTKSFCAQGQDVCFDALAQLHAASQKDTFSFLLLDRTHRTALKFIEEVLSEAHNTNRSVKITFAPEAGKRCDGSAPLLLEKDIITLEIIK